MGSYFDLDRMKDFSDGWQKGEVYDRLYDAGITNIYDNEKMGDCFYEFAMELCYEYEHRICNPFSYVKPGMNARLVWELHKSSLLTDFFGLPKYNWFYEGHKEGMSLQEIKAWRAKLLIQKFVDYEDHDWQYYWVLNSAFGSDKCDDFMIDAEMYFADRDENKPDDLGDPRKDWAWRMIPVKSYKPKIWV